MSIHTNPLHHVSYPRSNTYAAEWVFENLMGPNPLWLLESLTRHLTIEGGDRVLDLGCGKALTSIFLAKEFGAQVWATDLWIDAAENESRVREKGVDDLVHCVHAEAHNLAFDPGSFDAVVCVDAYHYFGTADLYLGYILGFLKPGGRIGVIVPALTEELGSEVPEELVPYWEWDFCSFHTPAWWAHHWEKTGRVHVESAGFMEDGWRDWLRFDEAMEARTSGWRKEGASRSAAMLRADQGRNLGFCQVVATKLEHPTR